MSFTRTLILSGIAHGLMVFFALSHVRSELSESKVQENLQHFVTVRLQLPSPSSAAESPSPLTEETIQPTQQTSSTQKATAPRPEAPKDQAVVEAPKVTKTRPKKALTAKHSAHTDTTNQHKPDASLTAAKSESTVNQPSASRPNTEGLSVKNVAVATKPTRNTKTLRRAAKKAYWQSLNRFFKRSGYTYPRRAELAGQEGKVYITVEIDPSGRIINASISKSSGFPILDDAALASVIAAKQLPPLPDQLSKRNRKFRIPIEYRLPT